MTDGWSRQTHSVAGCDGVVKAGTINDLLDESCENNKLIWYFVLDHACLMCAPTLGHLGYRLPKSGMPSSRICLATLGAAQLLFTCFFNVVSDQVFVEKRDSKGNVPMRRTVDHPLADNLCAPRAQTLMGFFQGICDI